MKIWVMAAIRTGYDILDAIIDHLPIAGVIGLDGDVNETTVSGYVNGRGWCAKRGLPFVGVNRYALNDPGERVILTSLEIDLLLVLGWQRLVPGWLIDHCRHGAIGVHGSSHGIAGGRGRSPQNWALILGDPEFHLSIFRLDERVDSGSVLATRTFPLSAFDDIKTSYYKSSLTTAALLVDAYRHDLLVAGRGEEQHGEARYLPQRTPDDGGIDWSRTTTEIHAFVRSLTRPYPGASTMIDGARMTVWVVRPFSITAELGADAKPGEVVAAFWSGDLVVRTGDGLLLLDDFDFHDAPAPAVGKGTVFDSCEHASQMAAIVERHLSRYPDAPLHHDVLAQAAPPRADTRMRNSLEDGHRAT